jgi:hypothetical protein
LTQGVDFFENYLEGIKIGQLDFRIIPNIDSSINRNISVDTIIDKLLPYLKHPGIYRENGKVVIGSFRPGAVSVNWWATFKTKLAAKGVPVSLMLTFLSMDTISNYLPIMDGYGLWSPAIEKAGDQKSHVEKAHSQNKKYMHSIRIQDARPKGLTFHESNNTQTFQAFWNSAVTSGTDWVQQLTWTDLSENTDLRPTTGMQYAFYDMAAYYITWLKTGHEPKITKDVLYYCHRIERTDCNYDKTKQTGGRWKNAKDDMSDVNNIEVVAFLTAPGSVRIRINDKKFNFDAPAGISNFSIPIENGTPVFQLRRAKELLLSVESGFDIRSEGIVYQDLAYRAGSTSRPPVSHIANPSK